MDEDFDEVAEEQDEAGEELDPNNPEHAFLILEKQFTRTIAEIEQDPQMSNYADEFNKMMEVLFEMHEKERKASEKCMDLEIQLSDNEQKLSLAGKIQESDQSYIKELKDQIQMAWKLADAAHAREQAAQEMIDNLRKQINSLSAELDFKNKMGADDAEEGELSKHKEGLQRERDKLVGEVTKLTERLNNALSYQEELESRASQVDLKLTEVTTQLEDQSIQIDRFKSIRDNLQAEVAELKIVIGSKENDIINLKEAVSYSNKVTQQVEQTVKEQKNVIEKMVKDAEVNITKYSKLQDDYDSINYTLEKTKKQFSKIAMEYKLKEDEVSKLKADHDRVSKSRELSDKRITFLEEVRDNLKTDNDKIRQLVMQMEHEVDEAKKKAEEFKRQLEKFTRDKDIITKNMLRQQGVQRDQLKLIKVQQQAKRKLESEIYNYVIERGNTAKQIKYLEKERDRLVEDQLELTKKIEDYMDEFKLKKAQISDLKKTLAESENKIRMQHNIFDTIRAERNALQKSLQESNAECSELKVKLKVSGHQTEQLKEDVSMKERLLVKEENILRKVTKEKENLRVELNTATDNTRKLKQEIVEMSAEEKRLHKVILKDDRLIRQQAKDLEQLMNERDILGSQLVRRNDELALLYEKIKILQTTLHSGEAQYEQRLEDIRLLKIEIRRLRQEKHLLTKSLNNMTDLRHEVFYLERDLNKERVKCKALEEELQNPMNIHRWRKLEGSDPEVYELLQKVQIMQKRLLKQIAIGIDRERQLKESQRVYFNLRQVLIKQPTPELKNQLVKTQRALTIRINKMKCLVSELNMSEFNVTQYKQDLDKKTEELKIVKQKYLKEKKARERRENFLKEDQTIDSFNQSGPQIKFTGGGFRMSVTNTNP